MPSSHSWILHLLSPSHEQARDNASHLPRQARAELSQGRTVRRSSVLHRWSRFIPSVVQGRGRTENGQSHIHRRDDAWVQYQKDASDNSFLSSNLTFRNLESPFLISDQAQENDALSVADLYELSINIDDSRQESAQGVSQLIPVTIFLRPCEYHAAKRLSLNRRQRNRLVATMRADTATYRKTSGKAHEKDWREIRRRIERKIAASAVQAISSKFDAKGLSTHKPNRPHTTEELCPFERKHEEDKIMFRAANPRTGVISPSNRTDSSHEGCSSPKLYGQKWKTKDNEWVSVTVDSPSKGKSSMTGQRRGSPESTSSLMNSIPGALPCDWEDQFVVHMPSAREPNPPTMTTQQIHSCQTEMAKNRSPSDMSKEFSASKKCNALRSPLEHEPSTQSEAQTSAFKSSTTKNYATDTQCLHPPVSPPTAPREYVTPDEVGKDRVSPIEEDSIEKLREHYKALTNGSFLGCKEMVGLYKNPDEILLFPNLDEDEMPYSITSPLPLPKTSPGKGQSLPQVVPESPNETGPIPVETNLPWSQTQRTVSEPHQQRAKYMLPQRTVTVPTSLRSALAPPSPSPKGKENAAQEQVSQFGWKAEMHMMKEENLKLPTTPPPDRPSLSGPPISLFPTYAGKEISLDRPDCKTRVPTPYYNEWSDASREQQSQQHPENNGTYTAEDTSRASEAQVQNLLSSVEKHSENHFRRSRGKAPSVAELDGFQVSNQIEHAKSTAPNSAPVPDKPIWEKAAQSRSPTHLSLKEESTQGVGECTKAKKGTFNVKVTDRPGKDKTSKTNTTSKPLLDPRKESDRLVETREAYRYALERRRRENSTPGKETAEKLAAQKLATQKLAEAREAYRKIQAQKLNEKGQGSQKVRKQSNPPKNHSVVTQNECNPDGVGSQKFASDGQAAHSFTLSLALDLSVLCLGQMHNLLRRSRLFHFSVILSDKVLVMVGHCLEVAKRSLDAIYTYRTTGSWPACKKEQIVTIIKDVATAVIYFILLGFMVMMLGKAAGYVVYMASWVVWLCRPFGWVYSGLGYVLLESK